MVLKIPPDMLTVAQLTKEVPPPLVEFQLVSLCSQNAHHQTVS